MTYFALVNPTKIPFKLTFFTLLIIFSLCISSANAGSSGNEIDIPFEKFTLSNGLTLIVHEDHKTPIIGVSIWYHVGSKNEPPHKTGFAHLFEHLMFNGSENYDDDYFKALKDAGASSINGSTTNDRTNYFQVIPTSALERTLWLESDRMGHFLGALNQEKLDEQRDVVKNEKRQRENQPYGKIWSHISQRTYPQQHPYSWPVIGSMAHLDAASLDDVKQWFSDYYHPANATIVLAGDITPEVAREEVELYFGSIKAGKPASQLVDWPAKRSGSVRERIYDNVPRNRIYMVWNAPSISDNDADLLDLGMAVLGGGSSSRLYQRLVQKEQLATSAYAYYMGREIAGQIWLSVDAKPGVSLAHIEAIINEEVALFLKKGPTSDELNRVKTSQLADFVRSIELVGGGSGKSGVLAYGQLYFNDPAHYKKSIRATEAADKRDVRAASQRWLSNGRYTLEVLPPAERTVSTLQAPRDKLPELSPAPEFHTPQFQRAELDNGLKILLVERKGAPLVEMALQMNAGYAADSLGKLGSANFSLSMLKQGTQTRSSQEISQESAMLGANIGASNTLDTSVIRLSALSKNLPDSIALFADIALKPLFSPEDIERKRGLILASIESEKANPTHMALRTLPPLLYGPHHAYGIPLTGTGTADSVKQINQQDLIDFHKTWFRPDNASLIVVGNSSLKEIKKLAQEQFGKWKNPATILPEKQLVDVSLPEKTRIYLIDKPGSEQSMIIAGHLVPSSQVKENTAISLMNSIFGGSFTSRLNLNLREDKGWAYGTGSSISSAIGQRPYFIYAPVQSDKTAESMVEILKELRAFLGDKPATEAELQSNVKDRILSLPGQLESSSALLSAITELERLKRPDDYLDQYNARLKAVTLESLNEAAQTTLHPNKLTWVIVGDKKKIEARIAALNIGEIFNIEDAKKDLPPHSAQ
ncbi:MAG: insulinase family protein [Pseudomonadales bacterium]|nr:insulinase family protein [Pseudomonadales bacterium]